MDDRSHRYSSDENQKSWKDHRDALETIFGRLYLRLPRSPAPSPVPAPSEEELDGRRRQVLGNALRVLRIVAAADTDQARQLNGVGFSKSDTTLGHRLSTATVDQALADRSLAQKIVKMAIRYIRQAFVFQTRGMF